RPLPCGRRRRLRRTKPVTESGRLSYRRCGGGVMILGITGGSGCGKTTALQAAGDLGGLILDCDAVYHRLLACSPALLDAISSRFPGVVSDGRLDRKKLGRIVFSDGNALQALNQIA